MTWGLRHCTFFEALVSLPSAEGVHPYHWLWDPQVHQQPIEAQSQTF